MKKYTKGAELNDQASWALWEQAATRSPRQSQHAARTQPPGESVRHSQACRISKTEDWVPLSRAEYEAIDCTQHTAENGDRQSGSAGEKRMQWILHAVLPAVVVHAVPEVVALEDVRAASKGFLRRETESWQAGTTCH